MAAVFIGVFVGVVPIYGLQSLIAIGLAAILRLNKPLTFGATFVNNPLLQPFLVITSIELGHYLLYGHLFTPPATGITALMIKDQLSAWFVGSVVLGALLGGTAASVVFLIVSLRSEERVRRRRAQRDSARFIKSLFEKCPGFDRGFVRWKLRLDKIFGILAMEDLGRGPAIDLGCGYGMALALAAFQQPGRHLIGCDLDKHRVGIAREALSPLKAELAVYDVRAFALRPAGLIMIIDVLQYLDSAEQQDLLKKCCSMLMPGGKLIFRIHDRNRKISSKLSLVLDKIIFRLSGINKRPTMLYPAEYTGVLQTAGMKVKSQHFLNKLPLAHVLFIAEKPGVSEASAGTDGSGVNPPVGR
jgi:uncharacterized protein (DUF2062 family)/energy-converting hydrogenase Eha subunit C